MGNIFLVLKVWVQLNIKWMYFVKKRLENKNAKVLKKKRGMDNFILNSEFSLNKEKSFKVALEWLKEKLKGFYLDEFPYKTLKFREHLLRHSYAWSTVIGIMEHAKL